MGRKNGFTLIELLVVVCILGVLALIGFASFNASRKRARDAERKSALNAIKTSLQLYYNIYGAYPSHNASNRIIGCNEPPTACAWGSPWTRGDNVFMKILPDDPISSQDYLYSRIDNETFRLVALLEIADDPDLIKSQTACAYGSGNQYVVCSD